MNLTPSLPTGTALIVGSFYRITAICPTDPDPTLHVGDVVACEADKRRCVRPDPDEGWWFADYLGDGDGYGTLVTGLVEIAAPDGDAVACEHVFLDSTTCVKCKFDPGGP